KGIGAVGESEPEKVTLRTTKLGIRNKAEGTKKRKVEEEGSDGEYLPGNEKGESDKETGDEGQSRGQQDDELLGKEYGAIQEDQSGTQGMTILWVEELGSDKMEMTLGGNCEEGGLKQMAEGGQSLWSGLEKKRKMPDQLPEVNESHKNARSMMGTVNDVEKNTTESSP
ncbi:hypothetical protein FRC02_005306, partial [Tulasnella sp. 418]